MQTEELIRRNDYALYRDPGEAVVGYHFGDSFGTAPCRTKWFSSVDELADHIIEVELGLCGYDVEMLDEYSGLLRPILAQIKKGGLTEEGRQALNSLKWGFSVFWWGTLQDLLSGQTQFSREMLGSFSVEQGGGRGVRLGQLHNFFEFLRHSCQWSSAASESCS